MRCKVERCQAHLTDIERATGKGKCIKCLIRGYQWVLSQMHREQEQMAAELQRLRAELLNRQPGTEPRR